MPSDICALPVSSAFKYVSRVLITTSILLVSVKIFVSASLFFVNNSIMLAFVTGSIVDNVLIVCSLALISVCKSVMLSPVNSVFVFSKFFSISFNPSSNLLAPLFSSSKLFTTFSRLSYICIVP